MAGSRFSRPVCVQWADELDPGDLVDMSTTLSRYWCVVDGVGVCGEDPERGRHCPNLGECVAVIWYTDPDPDVAEPRWQWHVLDGEEIHARICADAGLAEIAAENGAHEGLAQRYRCTAEGDVVGVGA